MNFHPYVIYFTLVLNIVATVRKKRIVGGTSASIEEFPHQVSIRLLSKNKHYCSGAILTETLILSAAHCFYGKEKYIPDIRIYAGSSSSTDLSIVGYKIFYIHFHPNFTGEQSVSSMYRHDISIIQIEGKIEFNAHLKPAKRPKKNISPGDLVYISGWGLTSYPGKISQILQKASMTIISNADCAKQNPLQFHNGQFCAVNSVGIGICLHDSGGPLTKKGKVIGIISFHVPCATDLPDMFTNVYYYESYIKDIIKMCS